MLTQIFMMIVEALGGFLTMLLLARALLRWQRISFINNPFGHFVLATTNWLVLPAQKVLPAAGRLELAAIVPAWGVQILLVLLGVTLSGQSFGNPASALVGLLSIGALQLFKTALHLLLAAVIIGAVMSWVNPHAPFAPMINRVTAPFLDPVRRVIPLIGGVDLSPLVLLLALQVLIAVINNIIGSFAPLLFA